MCDHGCACESITKGSIIYALRRCRLHLLHCSPLVFHVLCNAAYVAYPPPDIDIIRPRVGELSWSSLDRFCWLNVRFIITVKETQICTNRWVVINLFCKNIVFWTVNMVVNISYYTRLEPIKMNDRRFPPARLVIVYVASPSRSMILKGPFQGCPNIKKNANFLQQF